MHATFYILSPTTPQPDSSFPASFHVACTFISEQYRAQQRIFIYTNNQQSAHQVDDYLWAFNEDSFIPHNLAGEGPKQGAPVEISWQPPTNYRPILVNLSTEVPPFITQFKQVIDFVPVESELKQQARERYKLYRQFGFALNTITL